MQTVNVYVDWNVFYNSRKNSFRNNIVRALADIKDIRKSQVDIIVLYKNADEGKISLLDKGMSNYFIFKEDTDTIPNKLDKWNIFLSTDYDKLRKFDLANGKSILLWEIGEKKQWDGLFVQEGIDFEELKKRMRHLMHL